MRFFVVCWILLQSHLIWQSVRKNVYQMQSIKKKIEWYTFNVDVKLHQTGRIEVCHTANNGNRVYHCQIKH